MKRTEYFNTKEELDRYYPNGVPSMVLAIVKDDGAMYTSSNNESGGSRTEEQGGEPIADADRQYVDYTLEGEPEETEGE